MTSLPCKAVIFRISEVVWKSNFAWKFEINSQLFQKISIVTSSGYSPIPGHCTRLFSYKLCVIKHYGEISNWLQSALVVCFPIWRNREKRNFVKLRTPKLLAFRSLTLFIFKTIHEKFSKFLKWIPQMIFKTKIIFCLVSRASLSVEKKRKVKINFYKSSWCYFKPLKHFRIRKLNVRGCK